MRTLSATVLALLTLSACTTTPLPRHAPDKAWIDLNSQPAQRLTAQRLDGDLVEDGRYFQVTPGEHTLQMRFQYEDSRGGNMGIGARVVTCLLDIRYDEFAAGQRYFVEARPLAAKAQGYLYDNQRTLLSSATVRCGPY